MSNRTRPSGDHLPCVVCGKPQDETLRPFCSRRCADVDLHHWLSEAYALPAEDDGDGEDAPAEHSERLHGREGQGREHNRHNG